MRRFENLSLCLMNIPYLRKSFKGLDSILQNRIAKFKLQSKLKILLVGPTVHVMAQWIEVKFTDGPIDMKVLKEIQQVQNLCLETVCLAFACRTVLICFKKLKRMTFSLICVFCIRSSKSMHFLFS